MKQLYSLRSLVLTISLFLSLTYLNAATITSTAAGGTWATTTTWVGGVVPAIGDAVIIATTGSNSVIINADAACASLTINSGSILVSNTFTLTITGAWLNNGTFTPNSGTVLFTSTSGQINSGTGAANFNNISIGTTGGSATLSITTTTNVVCAAVRLTTPSEDTYKNILSVGSGSLTCASIALGGGSELATTRECDLSIGTGTVTVTGNVTNTDIGSNIKFTGAGTLNVGGNFMSMTPSGTFTRSTGKVNLNGAAQTSGVYSFNNLTLSGTLAKTFATSPTVYGILSMEGTATISVAPIYGASATLQYNTATSRTSGAEWLATFAATGGIIIANTGIITMNSAEILGLSVPLTINSGSKLNTGGYQLTLGGNFQNSGTFTAGASPIVIANIAATQTISGFTTTGLISMTKTGGTATFSGNVNGAGLTINGTGGTLNLGTGLMHTLSGDVTLTTGTLNGGSGTLNENSVSPTAWGGTGSLFTCGTGTVNFGGAGNQTLSASATIFNKLTLSNSGTKTFSTATTIGGAFTISGTAVANLGTGLSHTAATLMLGGTGRNSGTWGGTSSAATNKDATYFGTTATGIVTVSGSSCITGNWTGTTSTDWNTASNWCGGILPIASTNVIIPAGGNQPVINSSAVCKSLTISSGATLTITGSNTLTVSGNLSNGGTFTTNTSTVILNGTAQAISGSVTTFNNLTISNSGIKTFTTRPIVSGIISLEGTATVSTYPTYGSAATLQYNTLTARTAGNEWMANFAATGGIIIANTGIITMNSAEILSASVPLTINNGATLRTNNYQLTFGGNFINNGTFTAGSSPIVITNTMASQSIAGFTTTGLVSMTKTSGTATFTGNVTGAGLTINGTGGTLNLGSGLTHTFSGTWTRTAGTLDGGSSTINFTGAGTVVSGSGGTFTANTGTVGYTLAGVQTTGALTYNNLTLSGSSLKTTTGITVNGILSMEGTATASAVPSYSGSATLQYKGSGAQTTGSEFPATWAGTGGVKIENSNGVTLGAAKNIGTTPFTIGSSVAGSIFSDGGFQLTGTGTLNLTSGTFKLGAAAATAFPAFGTRNIATGTTVEYAATTTQTIKGITYSNLTISGSGLNSKTADADITVNGILNLGSANASATQGCLEMSTRTLNMGPAATTAGTGDVTGIVTRTSFAVNTPYSFGNQFTTLNMSAGGTLPTSVSFKIVLFPSDSWITTGLIKRYYDIIQTGGTSGTKVTLNLHYLTGELNGATESNLHVFDYHVSGPTLEDHGSSNSDIVNKWVGLANLSLTYVGQSSYGARYWTMGTSTTSTTSTWTGNTSTAWALTDNWTGGIPTSVSNVIIPNTTNKPTLPDGSTTVATIFIQSGGVLNATTGTPMLTIAGGTGAWENLGTFNAGTTSTVIFTNAAATMADPTNFYNVTVADGAILNLGTDNYMAIAGALSLSGTGVLNAASNHNTVEYNGAAQTVVFPNGSTTGYHNLILSGSGTKTMPSSAMTVYGDFSMSGSATAATINTLSIAGNFTLGGTTSLTAGAAVAFGGNVTLGSGTTFAPGIFAHTVSGNWTNNGATFSPGAGTVIFNNASASQSINGTASAQTFYNLNIDKAGQTLFIGGSTNTLNLFSIWILAGTLNPGAGSLIYISGDGWRNNGVFIPNGGTVFLTGSSSQEIRGNTSTTFDNLTINNTATGGSRVSLTSGDITVNGVLNLQSANASSSRGALDTSPYTLNMGATATTTGTGDVTGYVDRTSFNIGTSYTFGNQFNIVSFLSSSETLPTSLKFKISIGTEPGWQPTPTTHAILREYEIVNTGGVNCNANISLHYLDSELNGNTETLLSKFRWQADPLTITDLGRSAQNSTDNWIENNNVPIGLLPTTFGAVKISMANSSNPVLTWNGSSSSDWTNLDNWTPNSTPTETSSVIIPDVTNDPVIPSGGVTIKALEIQAGGNLNSSSQPVTITGSSGALINNGTFTAGTGTVTFTGTGATIYGTTNFYNLTISAGADLRNVINSIVRIAGTMTNNGVWHAVTGTEPSTVEYNGGNQTVAIPNPATNRYSTLILSGTGVKTMPNQQLSILGDFSLNGTASAFATQDINITGNFTIAAGTSFTASSAALNVGGNWNNSGTFTAGTGTVSFNGSSAQTINGNNTFNNLTINSAGVTTGYNQTVNGVLNLQSPNASAFSGSLDMGANILDMGPLATTTGTGDVTGIVRRTTFVAQTSYSFGNQFSKVSFIPGGTYPASLQVKLTIGNSPGWMTSAIKRVYELVNTGGSNCFANISLHYLDSELNGNLQERLVKFRWQNPSAITDMGRSNYNTTDNWIENDQVGIGLLPTAFGQVQISMANTTLASYTWNGSLNSDWENTSNWTPVGSPSNLSNVIIPDAGTTPNSPTLRTGGVSLQSISIENGGILNSGNQSLTLSGTSGAWINNGTFNAGTGTVILTGNGGTISGTTDFYNLTINSGADITNQIGSIIRIGGTMTNNGTWRAALLENTVEYNGGSQTVLNTNAPIPGYHNLILSGSGTKTMPVTALSVGGDFTLAGAASATAGNAMTVAGSFNIGSGSTFNAGGFTHLVGENWTNNGTFTATGSTIEFNGASAGNISASNFNNITISGTGTKTVTGTITASGNYNQTSGAFVFNNPASNSITISGNYTQSGGLFDFNTSGSGNSTMFLGGNMTQTSGAGSMTTSGAGAYNGVINFNGSGIQTLSIATPGGSIWVKYSAPSGKSVQLLSNITLSSANEVTEIPWQGEIIVDGTFDLGTFTVTQAGGVAGTAVFTVNSGANLITSNADGISGSISPANMITKLSSGANYEFRGASTGTFTTIPTAGTVNNLIINYSSVVTLTNSLTVAGTLSLVNGTLTLGANTLTIAGSSPTRTSGTIDAVNAGATLAFTNTAAITLPSSVFTGNVNNLTINGSGGINAGSDFTINGILNLQSANPSAVKGSLDMGTSYTLNMGASATTVGAGDVTGIIRRSTLNSGVTYTFGNQFMTVYFTTDGTRPSEMSTRISIGTAPGWITGAISREIEIIQTGGSATKALFSYHYLDSELNGNDEGHLVLWVKHTPANIEYGRSANNSTENWVSLSNVDVAFFSSTWDATKNITLAGYSTTSTLVWNGSLSESWTSVENWTPNNVGPSLVRNIIIPDVSLLSHSPTLPSVTEIKSLTIEAGGILNSVASAQLTINGSTGAWINNGGIFNPNTSNVIFSNRHATISGTTNYYSVTIPADTVDLLLTSGSTMRISGTMDNRGTWSIMREVPTTVEYNGGAQTVINPNGTIPGYYNLTLSGSGNKTTTGVTVNGILSMEGTSTASVAPTYGASAALQYNTATSRSAGSEWITPFTATGGLIIANTGTISLNESKVLNTSAPLTINSGSVLTIEVPYSLTADGSITNNAGATGLVIKSSLGGDGKLINNSTDVNATVELYLTGGASNFHFFVPPVSSMAIGTTLQNVNVNLGITNFNNDLMSYSESAAGADQNKGWQYYDGYTATGFTYAPFSTLISPKGYNIYLTAADVIKFKGTLNNAPHTFILNRSVNGMGWNLVGNPYPCNYDLTGVTSLMTPDNGLDKTIYFYHSGSYLYYNMAISAGTGGLTNIVPPMQGFFVRVNPSTDPMSFPAGSKTSSLSAPRSKKSNLLEVSPVEKIKLALSNSTVSDETIVCLIDKATTGFDGEYDAYKLFGSNPVVPDIYTELGLIKYAINSVPGPGSGQIRIPVVVVLKTPGTYKIDITEFENLEGMRVVLRHGTVETILSKNASYSFSAAAGTFTDFELIFGGTATAVEKTATENLKTWYINDFLYINCPAEITAGLGNMFIYDIQGKPVYNNTQLYLTPGQTLQLPLKLSKGVYLTHLTLNGQIFVSKFVVV